MQERILTLRKYCLANVQENKVLSADHVPTQNAIFLGISIVPLLILPSLSPSWIASESLSLRNPIGYIKARRKSVISKSSVYVDSDNKASAP